MLLWLLSEPTFASSVLAAIPRLKEEGADMPLDGPCLEFPIANRRADLAFTVRAANGHHLKVAIETKVADPVSDGQLKTYKAESTCRSSFFLVSPAS